ncbi:MAG: YndJ family protein [Ardenticatenales bacterium]|nr:YndJ family protein [Ardenticatenales bacterium]
MQRKEVNPTWNTHELAASGGVFWLLLVPFPLADGVLNTISKLLLLTILFFCPLLLSLISPVEENIFFYSRLRLLQLWAAFAVTFSFTVQQGTPGAGPALFASMWLLFTLLLALYGVLRLLPWRWPRAEELVISAGLIYLPVGAGWLVLSRLGANPLGFSDAIVLLTAIHFHYAGFAIPILVGMSGRLLTRSKAPSWATMLYRAVVAGVIVGPPLIALGITFSRPLEALAATIFALTLMAYSLLTLVIIVPRVSNRANQILLSLSSLILLVTMLLAMGYAVGGFSGWMALTIPQMVQFHGWGNALVVLFALIAWVRERPEAMVPNGESKIG